MTLWLMIEVIIFYSYIIVECLVALCIFGSMYRQHKLRLKLEADAAKERQENNDLEGGPDVAEKSAKKNMGSSVMSKKEKVQNVRGGEGNFFRDPFAEEQGVTQGGEQGIKDFQIAKEVDKAAERRNNKL